MSENKGKVITIIGCMFASKTTELLSRIEKNILAGKRCVIIKKDYDNRFSDDKQIITHNKFSPKVHVFTIVKVFTIKNLLEDFDDIDIHVHNWALKGKVIIIAALDSDYEMKPFKNTSKLIPVSDEVKKKHAICMKCKKKASFSKRITSEKGVILVGGKDKYEARCRFCFNS